VVYIGKPTKSHASGAVTSSFVGCLLNLNLCQVKTNKQTNKHIYTHIDIIEHGFKSSAFKRLKPHVSISKIHLKVVQGHDVYSEMKRFNLTKFQIRRLFNYCPFPQFI